MKYTFGTVSVDSDARTITSGAGSAHLTRKAFDLLLLLLECRPNAVSKEQIHARLWPDTFVAEASLQTLIHEIRHAIDGHGSRPSWIRTVRGIGYSFAGDAHASDASSAQAHLERPAAFLIGEAIRVGLYPGENIVGRGLDDVIEIEGSTISRRHARIEIGDTITLEDLGSKNGTWLNDERVTTRRTLAHSDQLRLGSATFTFRLARRSKTTESALTHSDNVDVKSR